MIYRPRNKTFLSFIFFAIALIGLPKLLSGQAEYPAEITVAQDGAGDYRTIQEAINSVRDLSQQVVTIHIKNGVYHEKIVVPSWKTKIHLLGEDEDKTIITNDDYSGKELPVGTELQGRHQYSTFNSYTLQVKGNDFMAENLTIQNSAGKVGQAVALHVEGDRAIFRNCHISGNQDTIYTATRASRQFYDHCLIEGTTDFIFGEATALFRDCEIRSLANSYITAAATLQGQLAGYIFLNCRLTAVSGVSKVFLGRPWRPYAKVIFANCVMDKHIAPEGWHNWNNKENERTAFYAEYKNSGPGAILDQRVSWSKQLTADELKSALDHVFDKTDIWDPQKN